MIYPSKVAFAFGSVLLLVTNNEFLAEKTISRAIDSLLSQRPDAIVHHVDAAGLAPGEFTALASPSLFSSSTVVALSNAESLSEDALMEVLAQANHPDDDIALILLHQGGNKGRKILTEIEKIPSVTRTNLAAPKYDKDFVAWVLTQAREAHGVAIAGPAADILVKSVGLDLRSLDAALGQLVAANEGNGTLDEKLVGTYFGGRAHVKGYEIADAAIEGRLAHALETARWAEQSAVAPVLIVSAFASGLRALAKVASAPPGMAGRELAAHAGVPPFKLRSLTNQARSWDPAGVQQALAAVAQADLDVKGAAADAGHAIERMIIKVARSRRR